MPYTDTAAGAQAVLEDLRIVTDTQDPARATYTPDDSIRGCWLATFPDGSRVLVYTGCHLLGPDFEEVENIS